VLISDEVYEDLVFDRTAPTFLRKDARSFVLAVYSFSKSYSMTGWRVGYLVGPAEVAAEVVKLQEVFYACASSVSQAAARAALTLPDSYLEQSKAIYLRRRGVLVDRLNKFSVPHFVPQGAFYCLIDVGDAQTATTPLALDLLKEAGVAVAPGETFGSLARGMVRVCFAVADETLEEGVERLGSYLSEQSASRSSLRPENNE
jgi:aspartate/methionine/tyrosine aminotransferase